MAKQPLSQMTASDEAGKTTHRAVPEPEREHAELRPGWTHVEHEGLPSPTYWPAVLAFGITLLAWGLLTTWIIAAVGLLVFVAALAGWIGDLQHGH